MGKIVRVFPRRTSFTPTDGLAFVGEPPAPMFFDGHDIDAIHISVTWTYDLEKADHLYEAWSQFGIPVEVGGPAFDDRMGDFTPGMYVKEGVIFTSRGCTKECWFCSVPRCSHGVIRELPICDGYNICDDNILGTSEQHFRAVIDMLKRQKEHAVFSGGLEPALLQQWQADLIASIKPKGVYTAYDTKDDWEPLVEMKRKFDAAPTRLWAHSLRCYVLVGYPDDTIGEAQKRVDQVMSLGIMPFTMLYRDEAGHTDNTWSKWNRRFANQWCAGHEMNEYLKRKGGMLL